MTITIFHRSSRRLLATITAESAWVAIELASRFSISIYRWSVQASDEGKRS